MIKIRLSKGRDVTKGIQVSSKGYVRVFVEDGVHTDPKTGARVDMVELAKANHFGTARIPARPFLDDAIRENWPDVKKAITSSMVWRFKGLKADVQFAFAANEIVHIVRQFILDGTYYRSVAPNAQTTIDNKQGDIPLLHTGQLVDHIVGEYVQLG